MRGVSEEFSDRLTAFLDILGFSNRVAEAARDDEIFERTFNALLMVRRSPPWWVSKSESDLRVTVFSDNIVVSSESTSAGASALLETIAHVCFQVISWGSFMRGGVTRGLLFHDAAMVFGPAMIEAHKLESKAAVYPRILLCNSAVELLQCLPSSKNFLYTDDDDGKKMLDYLSYRSALARDRVQLNGFRMRMRTLHSTITYRLCMETAPEVLKKYKWLARYYNRIAASRQEFNGLPRIPR